MTNLMSERHDGLVLSGLDVVVDEGDKGCVTAENITHTFTYMLYVIGNHRISKIP